jgi:DNA-directed RNA polymerase specialized sigma24 family protein
LMRYVEQLSNKEIALITQLDPKTISSVISMVTNKLRKQLIF